MKLDQHDARGVLDAHHRVGEAFGRKSLTHAGRALQDDVLLGTQQAHDRVVSLAVHVDLFEKFLDGILGQRHRHFLALKRVLLVLEKSLNTGQPDCVIGDLSEGLPHTPWLVKAPVSLVGPVDLSNVRVIAVVCIVDVVACDNASPDDLLSASFGKNNVARLHLLRELPGGMNVVRLPPVFWVGLEHPFFHVLFTVAYRQITESTPAQPHDSALVELLPHVRSLARRVQPVAHGLNAVIPESCSLHCYLLENHSHEYWLFVVMATPYHSGDRRHDSHSHSTDSKDGPRSRATRPLPRQSSPASHEVRQHTHVARCLTQALIAHL